MYSFPSPSGLLVQLLILTVFTHPLTAQHTVPPIDSLSFTDDEVISVPLLQLAGIESNVPAADIPYLSFLRALPHGPNGIELRWTKTDQRRAAHYVIQRSPDGRIYRTVGRIRARRQDENEYHYSFYDRRVKKRKFFYRLRQVNRDGSESYSHEVIFQRPKQTPPIALIPNPANGRQYTVKLGRIFRGEQLRVELLCPRGKRLRKRVVKHGDFKLTTKGLTAGVYTLRVLNDNQWLNRLVVVD